MIIKKIHYISGLTITLFIGLHLFNHFYSIFGADKHNEIMNSLRYFYRNIFVETILLLAVFVQIASGLKLFKLNRKTATSQFEKLHIWTGLYLAIFFIIHLTAVLGGRLFLHLDTNFYFGVAGLNSFPTNLFFYSLLWTCHSFLFRTHYFNSLQKNEIQYPKIDAKTTSKSYSLFRTYFDNYNILRTNKSFSRSNNSK
jgi:hypothetical protein